MTIFDMTSKLVSGKEIQIKVDTEKLDYRKREEIVAQYADNYLKISRLAGEAYLATGAVVVAMYLAAFYNLLFAMLAIVFAKIAFDAQYKLGYEKANHDDWASKYVVRVDRK